MDPATLQQFWNEARTQYLSFRASQPQTVETLKAALENAARRIDPNRRTSPYNIPSPYEVAFNSIMGDVTYCATKWLKDGMPPVPTV